jgi:hypothetical protein
MRIQIGILVERALLRTARARLSDSSINKLSIFVKFLNSYSNNNSKALYFSTSSIEAHPNKIRISRMTNSIDLLNKDILDKTIRIRPDNTRNRVGIWVVYKLNEKSVDREYNLSRSMDETIGETFHKLFHNIYKKEMKKNMRKVKKLKIEEEDEEAKSIAEKSSDGSVAEVDAEAEAESALISEEEIAKLPISLYDLSGRRLPYDTKNKDAWHDGYLFKINERSYEVSLNVPAIKRIALSHLLLAGMPAICKIEVDNYYNNESQTTLYDEYEKRVNNNSTFFWYCSKDEFAFDDQVPHDNHLSSNKVNALVQRRKKEMLEKVEWQLIASGTSMKMFRLKEECHKKLIKVECVPNDGVKRGKDSKWNNYFVVDSILVIFIFNKLLSKF